MEKVRNLRMAINYEPVGWDTTKHFNPTNMNHMDGGIKAACDKVDKHDSEIAEINSNLNVISGVITSNYSDNPIIYKYNGFMAMININGLKNIEKDKQVTIAILPEGARPTGSRVVDISNSDGAFVRLNIQSSGNVIVYNYNDIEPGNITLSFTYIK